MDQPACRLRKERKDEVRCLLSISYLVYCAGYSAWRLPVVAPTALDEVLASMTAAPATDASAPLEVASMNTDIEADIPEIEPSASPSELTIETLAGLWEIGCVSSEVNANGTYKAWSGRPQPGGFAKEAGTLELNGTQLTFHSGDDGLLCRNQSGTYEVIAWNSDEFELALVADDCTSREEVPSVPTGGCLGKMRRPRRQLLPAAGACADRGKGGRPAICNRTIT